MSKSVNPQMPQSSKDAASRYGTMSWQPRHWVGMLILWIIALVMLVVAALIVHTHPSPWPVELAFTNFIQGSHPIPCRYAVLPHDWLGNTADFINKFDDPLPSLAFPAFWMIVLALFRRFWQAIFLGLVVLSASTVWGGLSILVGRPRGTPAASICVHRVIAAYSFPSGHVIHDTAMYGFLIFLSFVLIREWRVRRFLIPLWIIAVLYLLALGYSRVEAGEHWLFDVLGGYLTSLVWLGICIFVFYHFNRWIDRRKLRKVKS